MNDRAIRYRVSGMDCASCASRIEKAARALGVETARVSTATQVMSVPATDAARLGELERAVSAAGYRLERLEDDANAGDGAAHLTGAYRRAMWAVIGLNVGYGIVEMVGGFLSGSQALKADALDFVGDGLITALGILAIGWSLLWRARSALLQGLLLGALGLGVLATTAYRVVALGELEAGLMGLFAVIALAVNLAAALLLLPHRGGDANVRAVWLFSRNDAIGNAAVLVAAGLVAWTGSAWPDLVVAAAIAGLFLHSSWSIVADARRDLRESTRSRARSVQGR